MTEAHRLYWLRIALRVVGLIFIFGIWPFTIIWPSGCAWHATGRSEYLEMILGIYATLGVFLLMASRDPIGSVPSIFVNVHAATWHVPRVRTARKRALPLCICS